MSQSNFHQKTENLIQQNQKTNLESNIQIPLSEPNLKIQSSTVQQNGIHFPVLPSYNQNMNQTPNSPPLYSPIQQHQNQHQNHQVLPLQSTHYLSKENSPMQTSEQLQPEKENMIFVGGISYKVSEPELLKCFEIYGKVDQVFIVRDPSNGYASKGYGFITFSDPKVAELVKHQEYIYLKGKFMNIGEAFRGGTKNTSPKVAEYPFYGIPHTPFPLEMISNHYY